MPLKTQGKRPGSRTYRSAKDRMQDLREKMGRSSRSPSTSTSRERAIANAGKKNVRKKRSGKFLTGKASPHTDKPTNALGKMRLLLKNARSRKPTGRLTADDIRRSTGGLKSMGLKGTGRKTMKRRGGGIVKRGMGMAK